MELPWHFYLAVFGTVICIGWLIYIWNDREKEREEQRRWKHRQKTGWRKQNPK